MSAEKPEVGDVWGVRGPQNRVLFVSENAVRFLTIAHNKIHPMIIVWPIEKFIAIMLKDNTWCHFPVWGLKDECEDNISFWNFEGLGDENTN